jgi:hypothetical protein
MFASKLSFMQPLCIDSLEEIIKFITSHMIDFVIISNIIWLKVFNCNRQMSKDKKSLNVWHDTFHPIVIKDIS